MASTDVESDDSTTVLPAAFVVEDPAEPVAKAVDPIGPPVPVMQDALSSNEVQLPVAQFGECVNDFALFTYAVSHGLTEDAFADLLKLGGCQAKYRTPFLMRKFIEASVNVEKRQVDCCLNGCVAFTHKLSHLTSCDACGTARYTASGRPARQMTYRPLTAWLVNILSDPVLGPDMRASMKEARGAAALNSDGTQRKGLHD